MKFYLLSAFLLFVPLAIAEEWVIAKFLYDDSHLIAEGYDHRYMSLKFYPDDSDYLDIATRSNKTGYSIEYMRLNSSAVRRLKTGFAIESFRINRRFDEKRDDYKVRSSKELMKLLMRDCFSTIALRQMTEEEQNQMAVFKEQQKGTKTNFKVVYDRRRIQMNTVGIDLIQLQTFDKSEGQQNDFDVFVDSISIDRAHIGINGTIAEKSFVVERPVSSSKTVCSLTGLPDLKPIECKGQIALRGLELKWFTSICEI